MKGPFLAPASAVSVPGFCSRATATTSPFSSAMAIRSPNRRRAPGTAGPARASRSSASRTTSCPGSACCSKRSFRTSRTRWRAAGAVDSTLLHPLPPFPDQVAASDRRPGSDAHRAPAGRRVGVRERGSARAARRDPARRPGDAACSLARLRSRRAACRRASAPRMGRDSRGPRRRCHRPTVAQPDWLVAARRAAPDEEQADCGFTYYTRYFSGTAAQRRGPG